MSLAPYFWPDPSKPDGLPYLRKDGQTNPEAKEFKKSSKTKNTCPGFAISFTSYHSRGIYQVTALMQNMLQNYCAYGFLTKPPA